MLVGGLGVAYSGNIGSSIAVFEPVHGSAPDIAGEHKANPMATFLSAAMMLDYLGETENARILRNAVHTCISAGDLTPDLGGSLTTEEVTQQIIISLNERSEL